MMQNHRRLSKPSRSSHFFSLTRYPSAVRVCLLVSFALAVYFHYRLSHSLNYTDSDNVLKSDVEFHPLDAYPESTLTTQSAVREWEEQTQNPMIGLYRYSSIATIQLPTSDLEVPELQPKQKGKDLLLNKDIVVLTMKGHKFNPEDNKRTPNQDRVLILSRQEVNSPDKNTANDDWWMGLFDGHGYYGHDVSQYASSEFAKRINKEWENKKSPLSSKASTATVKDTLRAIYLEVNQQMPKFMRSSGSTGISVLKKANALYISNIGDSVGFVASYDKTNDSLAIVYATKPHKPDDPSERKRIEAIGGEVQLPPLPGYSARLIIPMEFQGQKFEQGLAMSRSLGDHDGLGVGLSSEPDTDVLDLSQFDRTKEYFVIAATDGLIDFKKLSENEVALAMVKALSGNQDDSKIRRRLVSSRGTEAARELIMKSSDMWKAEGAGDYRDDISIVAQKLRI